MGLLPVPGKIYLNDFPDKTLYTITRNNVIVGKSDGLTNRDEDGKHIAFLFGTDIQIGDVISADYIKPVTVNLTGIDTYNGKPEIIKAYY